MKLTALARGMSSSRASGPLQGAFAEPLRSLCRPPRRPRVERYGQMLYASACSGTISTAGERQDCFQTLSHDAGQKTRFFMAQAGSVMSGPESGDMSVVVPQGQ